MEDAVKEEKIRREVGQPHVRLEELEEKLKALPANLTQAAEKIADSLETAYYAGYDDSPKRRFLKEYIQEKSRTLDCRGGSEGVLCRHHMELRTART